MSDQTAIAERPLNATTTEALQFGRQLGTEHKSAVTNPEHLKKLIAGEKRSQELLSARGKLVNGEEQHEDFDAFMANMEAKRREQPFTREDAKRLKEKFLGSETDASSEAKDLYKQIEKEIDDLVNFNEYAQIQRELDANPGSRTEIFANHKISESDFNNNRKEALKYFMRTSQIEEVDEVLKGIPKLEGKLRRVEETIATDPAASKLMEQHLHDVLKAARGLPEVEYTDAEKLSQEMKDAHDRRAQALKDAAKILAPFKGITDTADLENDLDEAINSGQDAATIVARIQAELFSEDPRYKTYQDYLDVKNVYDSALQNLHAVSTGRNRGSDQQLIEEYKKRVSEAAARLTDLTDKVNGWGLQKKEVISKFNNIHNHGTGNGKRGSLLDNIEEAVQARVDTRTAERKADRAKGLSTKERKNQEAKRLEAESDLLKQLQGISFSSLREVLSERNQEMIKAHKKYLEDIAEQAADAQKGDLKRVAEVMNKWIDYGDEDHRREEPEPQYSTIADNMRFLAWRGEEGVKQLMIRELGFNGQKDKDGNTIDYKTVDPDKLTFEQQERLSAVMEKYGDEYIKRLFASYNIARNTPTEKGGIFRFLRRHRPHPALELEQHEVRMLADKFGNKVEEFFQNSDEGQKQMQLLAEQGITKEKVGEKKWYIYLLAALGMSAATVLLGSGKILSSARIPTMNMAA